MTETQDKSFKDVQYAFAGHIRDPEGMPAPSDVEDRRMAIYRELFFNNVKGMLATNFPVLHRLYGEERWVDLIRDFFIRHRSHTPLFPELPREFLRFVETCRGEEHGDPPFLLELAHYEWAELALQLDEGEIDAVECRREGDLLAQAPVISPVAWLLSYVWPVHHIRDDFQPTAPPAAPTHLMVFRQRNDKVRFMELNAVTARLLQLISENPERTGLQHLAALAAEMGREAESLRAPGLQILEDLRKRDIIIGSR